MKRNTFPIGTLILFVAFVATMWATHLLVRPPAPPPELEGVLRSDYRLLQPFSLGDQHGRPFTNEQLRGKWSLVFFGYVSCPDVCPMTLHELASFRSLLRDDTNAEPDELQVAFVSVDPARDSPERLGEYVGHFNRRFLGLTGDRQQIDRLAGQLGAGYELQEETSPGQYAVMHSSAIFVIDPLGRSVATFSQPHYASTILAQYRRLTRYFGGKG